MSSHRFPQRLPRPAAVGFYHMAVYCFDLDNTLCLSYGDDYERSTPYENRIDAVNELYDQGHTVIVFTARGSLTGKDLGKFTEEQLLKWGLRFHSLQLGKPFADFYIDDKAVKDSEFFE